METSTLPSPAPQTPSAAAATMPTFDLPPQQLTSFADTIPRFRKSKAVKAIRSILGLFHKAGKSKPEKFMEDSKEIAPSLSETNNFTHTFSSQSSPSCTDDDFIMTPTSGASDRDSSRSSKMYCDEVPVKKIFFHENKNFGADAFSKIGNENDADEFTDKGQVDLKATEDRDEVFLNESYFEDDYFEDFSGSSCHGDGDVDVKFPMFSPKKGVHKNRTESCDCYKALDVLLADDFGVIEATLGTGLNRKRHTSMPCLKDWSSLPVEDVGSDEPSKSVAHLLHVCTPYFTLGMDMIADHFGDANAPDDDQKVRGENKVKDTEIMDTQKIVSNNDSSPLRTVNTFRSPKKDVTRKEEMEQCRTPLKQTFSIDGTAIQTPLRPYKRKPVESLCEEAISESHLPTPNKRGQKSRKNLYRDKRPSPLKVMDFCDVERKKRIADGLTSVAKWVMHVVALSGPKNDSKNELADSETKNIHESPLSLRNNQALDMGILPSHVQKNVLTVFQEKDPAFSPLSSESEVFHSVSADEDNHLDLRRLSVDENQDNIMKDIVTQPRSRLESGYASRSKCSTPSTPFSEPATPMSKLHLGKVISPHSLNKLDGLGARKNNIVQRQGKNAPTFLFPPRRTSPVLRTVPEVTESTSSSSGVVEKSSQSSNTDVDIHLDDVILSGGGDVESLVTSSNVGSTYSSSGSVFWSTSSTIPRDPHLVSINIIDENNNLVQQSPFTHILVEELPEISSPAIKQLQPISTSSPLQAIGSSDYLNPVVPRGNKYYVKSALCKQGDTAATAIRIEPQGKAENKNEKGEEKELKFHPRAPPEKRRKNVSSRSTRSARTCLRFGDRYENSSEQVVERKPSEEYIVLRKVAKFTLGLMHSRTKIKSHVDIPALMENLKENYLRVIQENATYEGIQFLPQLKLAVESSAEDVSQPLLTVETCVDHFLLNVLVRSKDKTISCADFIFQNLPNVVRRNPAFLSLAPELVALLLDNDHCTVKGPNGFPLSYRACEKEVLKVAVKFVEKCHRENQRNVHRVQRLLHQVVDPGIVLNDVIPLLGKSETDMTAVHVPITEPPRTPHRISYRHSHCPVESDSDVNALSMSLAHAHSLPRLMTSQCRPATSQNDRATLYQLTKSGTINMEAPVDVQTICDEDHFLKTIYFCYGSLEGVSYIADIGMQFIRKGKKKTFFLASPSSQNTSSAPSSVHTDNVKSQTASNNSKVQGTESPGSDTYLKPSPQEAHGVSLQATVSYPVSEQPNPVPLKKAAMILAPGEHITGVAVLGKSDLDLHNIEITTNTKRRIRAHGLPAVPGAQWTKLETPSREGAPFCLHALIGETCISPVTGTHLSGIGAVWAVTSWDTNDLNR